VVASRSFWILVSPTRVRVDPTKRKIGRGTKNSLLSVEPPNASVLPYVFFEVTSN
jgi:hypothetical protein